LELVAVVRRPGRAQLVDAAQFLIIAIAMANIAYFTTSSGTIRAAIVIVGTFAGNYAVWMIRGALKSQRR
jgi:hypothetical protein